jgi:hypothetical protein
MLSPHILRQSVVIALLLFSFQWSLQAQVSITETVRLKDKTVTVDLKNKALRRVLADKGILYAEFDRETYCFTIAYDPKKLIFEQFKSRLELILNEKGRRTQESISAYKLSGERLSLF